MEAGGGNTWSMAKGSERGEFDLGMMKRHSKCVQSCQGINKSIK